MSAGEKAIKNHPSYLFPVHWWEKENLAFHIETKNTMCHDCLVEKLYILFSFFFKIHLKKIIFRSNYAKDAIFFGKAFITCDFFSFFIDVCIKNVKSVMCMNTIKNM